MISGIRIHENLLVFKDVIKIADLGLAREINPSPPYTEYMSIHAHAGHLKYCYSRICTRQKLGDRIQASVKKVKKEWKEGECHEFRSTGMRSGPVLRGSYDCHMILPKGDLRQYLDRKGPLMQAQVVKLALD